MLLSRSAGERRSSRPPFVWGGEAGGQREGPLAGQAGGELRDQEINDMCDLNFHQNKAQNRRVNKTQISLYSFIFSLTCLPYNVSGFKA